MYVGSHRNAAGKLPCHTTILPNNHHETTSIFLEQRQASRTEFSSISCKSGTLNPLRKWVFRRLNFCQVHGLLCSWDSLPPVWLGDIQLIGISNKAGLHHTLPRFSIHWRIISIVLSLANKLNIWFCWTSYGDWSTWTLHIESWSSCSPLSCNTKGEQKKRTFGDVLRAPSKNVSHHHRNPWLGTAKNGEGILLYDRKMVSTYSSRSNTQHPK